MNSTVPNPWKGHDTSENAGMRGLLAAFWWLGMTALLAFNLWLPPATASSADKLEIPIPKAVGDGLESVGIEVKSHWTEEPAVWIAAAIIVAGIAIAYAIRQRKA